VTNKDNKQTLHEKNLAGAPKNFIVPFLLLSLRDFNLHGYKLIERLSDFGFQSLDPGNIYRTLRQLEKDELITSVWDTSAGGPAKRIYSLTKTGEKYLEAWAASLEQYQQIINSFFSMYTKMLFPFNESSEEKNTKPSKIEESKQTE
jgi:PadR family transcriptional regulator, regulatory protein PadR